MSAGLPPQPRRTAAKREAPAAARLAGREERLVRCLQAGRLQLTSLRRYVQRGWALEASANLGADGGMATGGMRIEMSRFGQSRYR